MTALAHDWRPRGRLLAVHFSRCDRCGLISTLTPAGSFFLILAPLVWKNGDIVERAGVVRMRPGSFVFPADVPKSKHMRWIQEAPAAGTVAALEFVAAPNCELGAPPPCRAPEKVGIPCAATEATTPTKAAIEKAPVSSPAQPTRRGTQLGLSLPPAKAVY